MHQHFDVSYNLGNHDMLGMSESQIQAQDWQKKRLGKTTLLSFAGWYDYSFTPQISPQKILANKNIYWFDRRIQRELDDAATTSQILIQLKAELASIDTPIIVAMHFVPHSHFLLKHPYFQRFNAFLGSQSFHDIFNKYAVTDVVFGHIHHHYAPTQLDNITYHAKPLGYAREWQLTHNFYKCHPQYQGNQPHRLAKNYNAIKHLPEFQTFRNQHLKTEFQKAITLFDNL